ncbi:Protein scarlet [Blattella germanica]|nr:Protein scarlet [Blattella germanica]
MSVEDWQKQGRGYAEWNPSRDGVTLTWRDVSVYSVVKDNSDFCRSKLSFKRIINNVTGAVKPGSLVALMGGSGAGKSTLMAALAYRAPAGVVVDGDIRVNGRPLGEYMHRLSGFMHQEDLFVSSLTVREHLNFMARLRLDRRTSAIDRKRKVCELLTELGLTPTADTQIGTFGRNKLLTNPPLLFCDEPTTGLDSFSAQQIVKKMKQMASEGRTILCTIHQPSSELFGMFHQLILVADGRIAFVGDTDSALEFFSRHGYECPKTYNPADFFIQTLAMTPGAEDASRQAVKKLCDEFAVSDAAREVDLHAIAMMVGLCYVGTVLETQTGVQSIQGALFILVTENTFTPMYSVLALFPLEVPLFIREYRSGLYSVHLFYLAKIFAMWSDVKNITCETMDVDLPCLRDGSEVLDKYSFSPNHFSRDLVAMVTLYLTFHALGYLCLCSRAKNS